MTSSTSNLLTPDLTPSHSITSSPSLPPTPDSRHLDIVIAHYNESLDWLSSYGNVASVYSKGQSPPNPSLYRETQALPNWGRESHTYLHHIVHNYDSLADVTLFLQGNIHGTNDGTPAHTDLTLDEIVGMAKRLTDLPNLTACEDFQAQNEPQGCVLPLGKINTFSDWAGVKYLPSWVERRGNGLHLSKYTPEQFFNYLINSTTDKTDARWTTPPSEIRWTQGALFAATRHAVQRRSREVYVRAYEYFHGLEDVNPEEGHYMERFWLCLLGAHNSVQQVSRGSHIGKVKGSVGDGSDNDREVEEEGIFVLEA
ncbi:hypothetical protein G647_06025 [Cladophialophora carrionii CBS 160.54]|uniref:Uncharacterized protein n=1 Tax=Cladophialophora carrionii CBS 160.54 TaxID=1279043 RepID=V9D512_9EURO|nr:uncharacterized protein G647_06025 [Cladophialophora carrionii CBS 160.54]ETI21955.1 hypothetical protein G647_06025 [Cladophialophora carrionii CBS 160.54]